MRKLITFSICLLLFARLEAAVRIVEPKLLIGQNWGEAAFCWHLESDENNVLQTAYLIEISDSDGSFRRPLWSSGKVRSDRSLYVPYGGPVLDPSSVYRYRITVWTNRGKASNRAEGVWLTGLDRRRGRWIGVDTPIGRDSVGRTMLPARYLRNEFFLESKPSSAILHVSGLGNSNCHINGRRLSEDVLGPAPSWYDSTVYYLSFDVTEMLRKGNNCIAAELGNGRYTGMRSPTRRMHPVFGTPVLFCELHLKYDDGRQEVICSGPDWHASDRGPVTRNNEYDGEDYDERLSFGNWTSPDFVEDERWKPADVLPSPKGVLRQQTCPTIRVQDTLKPLSVKQCHDGRVIVDMGQNMVGRIRFRLRGHKSDTLVFRYSEVLEGDDDLYVENLRSSVVRDSYVPASDGMFEWAPEFVYHGFRFVEISGLDYLPGPESFSGEVIYDLMQTTGSFECSDTILNALHRNAFWGIRGNYRGMPTDCPQRDERMPWLGDRATGCYGEAYIFDNQALYEKWARDMQEAMNSEGDMPAVAPRYYAFYEHDVTWPSAFINTVDMLYRHYGNERVVAERYDAMKRWVERTKAIGMVDSVMVNDNFGDWCLPPEDISFIHSKDASRKTSKPVLASTVFYDQLLKLASFARLLGYDQDAELYERDARNLRKAFNDKYFDESNCIYDNGSVTSGLLALGLGLVPDGYRQKLADNIASCTIERWGGHVSCGVLGIQHLMRALSENAYADLAYSIASSDTYPSWGYMVSRGATTIWELWNGDTADPAMNSRNHVMLLGDLIIWMYEYLGGIRPAEPGFRRIEVAPLMPEGLEHVAVTYKSPCGPVSNRWERKDGAFRMQLSVPAGVEAIVRLPFKAKCGSMVSDSFELGSGNYEFFANY